VGAVTDQSEVAHPTVDVTGLLLAHNHGFAAVDDGEAFDLSVWADRFVISDPTAEYTAGQGGVILGAFATGAGIVFKVRHQG
jgi:hypothetical protein